MTPSSLTRALKRKEQDTTRKLAMDDPRQFWKDRLETKRGWMLDNAARLQTDLTDLRFYAHKAEEASIFDPQLDALLKDAADAASMVRLQLVDIRAALQQKLTLEAAE